MTKMSIQLVFVILYSLSACTATTLAFSPLAGGDFGSTRSTITTARNAALGSLSKSNEQEISRRVALVTTAALAAGVTPAMAATLEKQVSTLEKLNLAQVNTKGAPEKHLPSVSVREGTVQVTVPHVMDPEKPHYIEYVWLKDVKTSKILAVKSFQATDPSPPTLTASVAAGSSVKPLLYCNLHGLWEGEPLVV